MKKLNNLIFNEGYHDVRVTIQSAKGCFLYDHQQKQYLDTTLGSGTHILGHSSHVITTALHEQIDKATLFTFSNELAFETAELIQKAVPSTEKIVFCNTGTEATMRAARVARTYTKKNKIAFFSGGWHGGSELYLFELEDNKIIHRSAGVPNSFKENVIVLPYNEAQAFKILKNEHQDIAMVIIEPAQGSNPRDDMKEFLEKLRKVTLQYNILLCFDEMITGFRIALGGAQSYYNIQADLVTYGKTIGGGVPIGILTGKEEILSIIKGDNNNLATFMGGTFSANPLSMATAKALLTYLIDHEKSVYQNLNQNALFIKDQINSFCLQTNIPIQIIGFGSMLRLIFTDHPIRSRKERDFYEISQDVQQQFFDHLLFEKQIFVNNNRIIFLSTTYTNETTKYLVNSILDTLTKFHKKGLLNAYH
jgi:glutamate-1-semialdehyde-2,1-aminomutase